MQQGELSFMHKEKIRDLTKLWKIELLTAINLTESLLAYLKGQLLGKKTHLVGPMFLTVGTDGCLS